MRKIGTVNDALVDRKVISVLYRRLDWIFGKKSFAFLVGHSQLTALTVSLCVGMTEVNDRFA